jgi:hypothetical protein
MHKKNRVTTRRLIDAKVQLRHGHILPIDHDDLRPGWQRDEEAGLPLTMLQRVQKKRGFTIANFLSCSRPPLAAAGIGLLATSQSLGQSVAGLSTLAVAAATDAEGGWARATGTDNPTSGARYDALADGAAAAVIGVGAIACDMIPLVPMLEIYLPKLLNGVNARRAELQGLNPFTDKFDKTVEAARWLVAGSFALDYANLGGFDIDLGATPPWSATVVAAAGLASSYRQYQRRRRGLKAAKSGRVRITQID